MHFGEFQTRVCSRYDTLSKGMGRFVNSIFDPHNQLKNVQNYSFFLVSSRMFPIVLIVPKQAFCLGEFKFYVC